MTADHLTPVQQGGPTRRVGLLSPVADPQIITWTAQAGFDIYILDCEHGPQTITDVHNACRAGRAAGIEMWVRVPVPDRVWISQSLDAGASGLLIPHVTTGQDVEHIVEYARYPPLGNRGIASVAGNDYGKKDLLQVNASTSLWVQLESPESIASASDILTAGDIQGTLIGPTDLKGRLTGDAAEKNSQLLTLTQQTCETARRTNRSFGVVVSDVDEVRNYQSNGVSPDLVIVGARYEFVAQLTTTAANMRSLP